MKVGSTVYWLHGDHLGSASLTTNSSGGIYAQQRYFPYGEVRWSSGSLPTDRQYTGQRNETTLGIYDYKARFYSPRLGRFLSADTLVPGVGSQHLSRYMYTVGNPLKYSDPSGHLGEDEIMHYFDVSTWNEVLALFEEGQVLAGRWGWLETLRQAELGDEIRFHADVSGLWPPSDPMVLIGNLVDRDGKLYIQSGDDQIAVNDAAWLGNAYSIWRSIQQDDPFVPYSGPLLADRMYARLRYNFSRVDTEGVMLDTIGIVTGLAEPHPLAALVGLCAGLRSVARTDALAKAGMADDIDIILDIGGFLMPKLGIVPDTISLIRGLASGFYYSP